MPDFKLGDLFTEGASGFWIDANNRWAMRQDAAGTIPVTEDGQPVGFMRETSGTNQPLTQASAPKCPIYRTDGTQSWLELTGGQYLEGTNLLNSEDAAATQFTVMAVIEQPVAEGMALFNAYRAEEPSYGISLATPGPDVTLYQLAVTDAVEAGIVECKNPGPDPVALIGRVNLITGDSTLVAGAESNTAAMNPFIPGFPGVPFAVGAGVGGTFGFKGKLYSFLCVSRYITDDEQAQALTELKRLAGIQ
ncbi:hypothetical protein SKUL_6 [Pseudomonas phage Skulduggery]|uniref:Uncharacterized protein n=1 Tax=Pseudomonas phage Skulduggery TaxID=2006671 RepID=A0A1Y0SX66_9CAUD|nr:hypothetical protein PP627_gp06 [Pseudomonas phage Skulduggery]ARV77105.1 hypothetical protein SKUL_6 [Pseudomonas phage Skulduggery]